MRVVVVCVLAGLLGACGGGGGSASPRSYHVTTTALSGGAIQPSTATVTGGGTATFTVTTSSGYAVDTVGGCGGTLNGGTYTTASIGADCIVTAAFRAIEFHVDVVGNAVGGLMIDNNGNDPLAIDTDGRFGFTSGINVGASYSVRVVQQPTTQICRVDNGTGTVSATAPIVVGVRCVERIVSTLLLTLRSTLDASGEFAQTLYVRSPGATLHQYRVRQTDGGLDEIAPAWTPFAFAQTFTFSADGTRAFADDGVGDVASVRVRDSDGALAQAWSQLFGNYAPTLPIPLDSVRPSQDGAILYRSVVLVVGGFRYQDFWVGAVGDSSVAPLAGSPFSLGSDGGGPNFDPTGRYFVRGVRSTGLLEVYGAFTSTTASPPLVHSSPRTLPGSTTLYADTSSGKYLYEAGFAQVTGTAQVSPPQIAVHAWQPDGSLTALGGPLEGAALTGELVSELCFNGATATARFSAFIPLAGAAGSARYLVQRQDTRCAAPFATGLMDSRVLGVSALTVTQGQSARAALPLDALPGWTDLGAGGALHPTRPWLYLGSKHAQRVYAYAVDAIAATAQPLQGSPYDGQSVPPVADAALPVVLLEPTGRFLYMARLPEIPSSTFVDAFAVDGSTGALTAVATYTP
jgi:hypothetical protein